MAKQPTAKGPSGLTDYGTRESFLSVFGWGYIFYSNDNPSATFDITVKFKSKDGTTTGPKVATGTFQIFTGDTLDVAPLPDVTLYLGQTLSDYEQGGQFSRKEIFSNPEHQFYVGRTAYYGVLHNPTGEATEYALYMTVYKQNADNPDQWTELYHTYGGSSSDWTGDASLPLSGYNTPTPRSLSGTASASYLHSLSWDLTARQTGRYRVEYHLYPLDAVSRGWSYGWQWSTSTVGKTVVQYINVVDKVKPVITVGHANYVVLAGQPFAKPYVTVTLPSGADITDECTLSFTSSDIALNADGSLTNTNVSDSKTSTVTVTATVPTTYDTPDAVTFTLTILKEAWGYDIMADSPLPATPEQGNYNKLVFLNTTDGATAQADGEHYLTTLASGITIRALPGLAVTIGSKGEGASHTFDLDYTGTDQTFDGKPLLSLDGPQVTYDNDNIPTSGLFFMFQPTVNGFLTIDADEWLAGNTYALLIKGDDGKAQIIGTYKPTTTRSGEQMINKPLMAGHTYYLVNGGQEGHAAATRLRGIEYQPAFVWTASDIRPVDMATAYYFKDDDGTVYTITEGLPGLVDGKTNGVTFSVSSQACNHTAAGDEPASYPGYSGSYATIANDGTVTPTHQTTDEIESGNDNEQAVPRVKVSATVASLEKSGVTATAAYYMRISGINAYAVPYDYSPAIRETHTMYIGGEPAVTLTWGGWNETDQIVYQQQNAWLGASLGSASEFDTTVDGLKWQAHMNGIDEPTDEMAQSFDLTEPTDADGNQRLRRYQLPCRGDYVTFKPLMHGRLYVYTLQPGVVQWDGLKASPTTAEQLWKWNPTFVVDERGLAVKGMGDEGSATAVTHKTSSNVRAKLDQSAWTGTSADASHPDVTVTFQPTSDGTMDTGKRDFIANNWGTAGSQQKVISLDDYYSTASTSGSTTTSGEAITNTGGHLIPFQGYVRHGFEVFPGKTYYVFTPKDRLGCSGFAFAPEEDTEQATLTLNAAETYTPATQSGNHLTVTLTGKKFYRDSWNSVCLPFSMNEEQVRATFGAGTEITVLNRAEMDEKQTRLYFMEHYYQHLVAGVPCFIRPTFKDANGNALYATTADDGTVTSNLLTAKDGREYMDGLTFRDVAIVEGEDALKSDATATATLGGVTYTFTMKGIYTKQAQNLPANSYLLSGGKLYFTTVALSSGAFNSYIEVTSSDGSTPPAAKMGFVSFKGDDIADGGTATRIGGIVSHRSSDVPATEGVFSLTGQRLGTTTDGLPAGVYIVNSRKVIVKP